MTAASTTTNGTAGSAWAAATSSLKRRMIQGQSHASNAARSTGSAKTICPSWRRSTSPCPSSILSPHRLTTCSLIFGRRRTSCPNSSPESNRAPRRTNSAAIELLPLPMPPIRPMIGFLVSAIGFRRFQQAPTSFGQRTTLPLGQEGIVSPFFALDRLDSQVRRQTTDRVDILAHVACSLDLSQVDEALVLDQCFGCLLVADLVRFQRPAGGHILAVRADNDVVTPGFPDGLFPVNDVPQQPRVIFSFLL